MSDKQYYKIIFVYLLLISIISYSPLVSDVLSDVNFNATSLLSPFSKARDSGYFSEGSALWITMIVGAISWLFSKYNDKKKNKRLPTGVVYTDISY